MKDLPGTHEEISLLRKRIKELEQSQSHAKKAEEALRASEARYSSEQNFSQLLLDTSPALIVAIGFDGKTVMMNQALLDILEYTREEIQGTDYLKTFVPEEDHRMLAAIFQQIVDEGKATVNENRIRSKSGRICLVEWHGRTAFHKEGDLHFFLGVGIDITERKEAQERIAKSEQRFRNLSGASLEAIVFTEDGIIVDANEALNRLFGYEGEDLRGRQATDFIEPERRPFTDKRMRARTEGAYETLGLRKDGSTFPIEVNPREFEQDGKRLRISAVRDLTEHRKIEKQLKDYQEHLERLVEERTAEMQEEAARRRAKEEQYLSLVESMVEYVWETDAYFIYTYLSSRIYDVLGYKPQELLGKSPADIMPPEEKERATPLIRKIFSKKQAFTSFQAVHTRRDGRLVFIEANGTPYFDKAGTLLGYRGSCHDVTEQKEAMDTLRDREQQLESKSKTLEEVNAALRVLLKQRENDRKDLEAAFMSNIREMVLPYIQKLQKNSLDPRHRTYLDIAAANLNEIISPFPNTIRQLNFTPREMEVATHIREGRTTKEAAEIMGVAPSAIHSHRDNIRKKLGLNNQKVNLRSYLLSLT